MRGTAAGLSMPTHHCMMKSSINAIALDGQEELVKVKGNLNGIPLTAPVDSEDQRSCVSVQVLNKVGIPPRDWRASSVKITYGNQETFNSLGLSGEPCILKKLSSSLKLMRS